MYIYIYIGGGSLGEVIVRLRHVASLAGHKGAVYCATFSHDGQVKCNDRMCSLSSRMCSLSSRMCSLGVRP